MKDAFSILALHVSETLPDSLSKRKTVLTALDDLLVTDHPAKRSVKSLLTDLDHMEREQLFLSNEFQRLISEGTRK